MEEENKVEESVTEQTALDTAEETTTEEVVEETKVTEEVTPVEDAKEEIKKEENITPVEENNNTVKEDKKKDKKKYNTFRTIAVILIIILIILLLCFKCGNGKKYKIILHNGDEIIEVDENFKLSDLEVEGGIVSFLVDSDGHIVDPSKKLDPKKEYSTHIIPEGKEKVKVTYVNGEWSLTVEYQKGAGLLFPADPTKSGYVFIGWKDEDADDYPIFMTPVNHDMTLVAQFGKSESKGGKCTLNCDTDGDGKCDLNCDTNGDGKPDTNIDLDGDGKCDLNCDADGDGKCDYKCDTDGDGACDLDCDELKQMDRSGKKKYDCAEDPNELTIVPFLTKTSSVLSATLDGEKVEPIGYDEGIDKFGREYKNPIFALGKYNGSGKTHILKVDYYVHDETGNKYFLHFEYELFFKDNCEKNNTEIPEKTSTSSSIIGCKTLIATEMDNDGELVSSTFDGKEVQPDSWSYNENSNKKYAVWNCEEYRGSGKTVVFVSKVLDIDENGDKYYKIETSNITFTDGCDDNNTDPVPQPQPQPSETYTCPDGYTLNGKKCTKEVIDVKNAKVSSYSCASGFTYDASDGKCHKTENLGCPDGYTDDGNGCSKKVTVELICGNPYHVCGNNCCEDDGTITQRVQPHCSYGYSLSNSGDKCETWVYENRICVGNNSTQIPGSFLCDVVDNATPNYSCSSYGSDYLLEETKCTKTTTETINATKK